MDNRIIGGYARHRMGDHIQTLNTGCGRSERRNAGLYFGSARSQANTGHRRTTVRTEAMPDAVLQQLEAMTADEPRAASGTMGVLAAIARQIADIDIP